MDFYFNEAQKKLLDFLPSRVWLGVLIGGLLVPLGLAAAYVYGGGMELVGNNAFLQIDSYVFTAVLLVGGVGVSGSFYAYFRDLSSTAAVFVSMVTGLYFGLVDVFVYLLLPDTGMPRVFEWLNDSLVGIVAGLIGFSEVTRFALFCVVVLTGLLCLVLVKILYSVEAEFLGLEV